MTQLKTGAGSGNADIEQYFYDQPTGLLTNQKVFKPNNNNQLLLDQSYDYERTYFNGGFSNGAVNGGKTGQLTRIVNNLDANKNRMYEFDGLGRLRNARGGAAAGVGNPQANWTQNYETVKHFGT